MQFTQRNYSKKTYTQAVHVPADISNAGEGFGETMYFPCKVSKRFDKSCKRSCVHKLPTPYTLLVLDFKKIFKLVKSVIKV